MARLRNGAIPAMPNNTEWRPRLGRSLGFAGSPHDASASDGHDHHKRHEDVELPGDGTGEYDYDTAIHGGRVGECVFTPPLPPSSGSVY